MRHFILGLSALLTLQPVTAIAATPTTKPAADCSVYDRQFEDISKVMADLYAQGIADDSAPRATNRELRIGNELTKATILIEIMKGAKCPLPTEVPSIAAYLSSALSCSNAQSDYKLSTYKGTAADQAAKRSAALTACDYATWVRGS